MEAKAMVRLLLICLLFSFILSSSAISTTRSLMPNHENSPIKGSLKKGALDLGDEEEPLVEKKGRGDNDQVNMEPIHKDYGNPHPNPHPWPPSRV